MSPEPMFSEERLTELALGLGRRYRWVDSSGFRELFYCYVWLEHAVAYSVSNPGEFFGEIAADDRIEEQQLIREQIVSEVESTDRKIQYERLRNTSSAKKQGSRVRVRTDKTSQPVEGTMLQDFSRDRKYVSVEFDDGRVGRYSKRSLESVVTKAEASRNKRINEALLETVAQTSFDAFLDNIIGQIQESRPDYTREEARNVTLWGVHRVFRREKRELFYKKLEVLLAEELIREGVLFRGNRENYYGVNSNGLLRFQAPRLFAVYNDPKLYSTPDMFSPPSERRPHVLRLELTTGCDYRGCTFCSGYEGVRFSEKTFESFMKHYNEVWKRLGREVQNIRRVFIGGGNALSADQKTWLKVLKTVKRDFIPRRIATYGRTDAILEKDTEGMRALKRAGLDLVYLGIESGSNEVLKYVHKKATYHEIVGACKIASFVGLQLSVMVMPGLGGIRYYDAHVRETARLLEEIDPKYITFMAVNAAPETRYARRMQEEVEAGTNRPLNDQEIVRQVKEIVDSLPYLSGKVGMFDNCIDQVGRNPIEFNEKLDHYGREKIDNACRYASQKMFLAERSV